MGCSGGKHSDTVEFWFGDLWPSVRDGRWDFVWGGLESSQYSLRVRGRYPTIDDTSADRISKKYGDYGAYRFRHASEVIQEIRACLGKNLDEDIIYPVTMVDSIGRFDFSLIAYNRQVHNRRIVLWPLQYHLDECRKGFDDPIPFESKKFGVVFRGSCSSPYKSSDSKTSRYEIVLRNHLHPLADLGLTKLELYVNGSGIDRESLRLLDKGILTREEQMAYQLVLCIEGADISTSFGWVLASHCVAIHPYPFLYEVWYFKDLRPWVHFIPISLDGSDLADTIEWCRLHPKECRSIAETGREYMHAMCDPVLLMETKHTIAHMWKLRRPKP